MKVTVLGAGAYGLALALAFYRNLCYTINCIGGLYG